MKNNLQSKMRNEINSKTCTYITLIYTNMINTCSNIIKINTEETRVDILHSSYLLLPKIETPPPYDEDEDRFWVLEVEASFLAYT